MEGIDAALERLDLEYIDLLLLHQPMGDYIGGYQAMEQAVAEGKVRAIGLSNFSPEQFEEVMAIAAIPPAVHQVETHLHNQQTAMMEYLDQYGTVLEAWFPLTVSEPATDKRMEALHGKKHSGFPDCRRPVMRSFIGVRRDGRRGG